MCPDAEFWIFCKRNDSCHWIFQDSSCKNSCYCSVSELEEKVLKLFIFFFREQITAGSCVWDQELGSGYAQRKHSNSRAQKKKCREKTKIAETHEKNPSPWLQNEMSQLEMSQLSYWIEKNKKVWWILKAWRFIELFVIIGSLLLSVQMHLSLFL